MSTDIKKMYERAYVAFKVVEFWPQDKVDEMVAAVGWAWQKEENAMAMAKLAIEESSIGVYEDKVAKIQSKTRGSLWQMRDVKTCGLVRVDKEKGLKIYAKPMGVIANVVPSTNPESTVTALGVNILKTRNAMIVSPHPRTKGSTNLAVEIGRKALIKIGAPVDLMQCLSEPGHANAVELMQLCDFTVATGGAALAKVVHQAGKPSHTVGAGNVVSMVDNTVDLPSAAAKIVKSKIANNSASCSSENAVAVEEDAFNEMVAALQAEGGYLCSTKERERLREYYWPDGKSLNRDVVAKPVKHLAKQAKIEIPEGTRFLMVMGGKPGPEDRFSGEKVSLVLTLWKWTDFSEMIDRIKIMLEFSGLGHSVSIHSNREDRQDELALKLNVGRVNCNMPHAMANSGSWFNGQSFTDSLGGGTWAGNNTSENIIWKHFLNYTSLSVPIPEFIPTDDDIFGDYFKKWGRD
jgi:sulfoacetaldehyde dehydrogenase